MEMSTVSKDLLAALGKLCETELTIYAFVPANSCILETIPHLANYSAADIRGELLAMNFSYVFDEGTEVHKVDTTKQIQEPADGFCLFAKLKIYSKRANW